MENEELIPNKIYTIFGAGGMMGAARYCKDLRWRQYGDFMGTKHLTEVFPDTWVEFQAADPFGIGLFYQPGDEIECELATIREAICLEGKPSVYSVKYEPRVKE